MSKFELQKKIFLIEKNNDDVIFPVSVLVSNFASLGLEAKFETKTGLGLGLGLGKFFRSWSWSRISRSRLQPWYTAFCLVWQ